MLGTLLDIDHPSTKTLRSVLCNWLLNDQSLLTRFIARYIEETGHLKDAVMVGEDNGIGSEAVVTTSESTLLAKPTNTPSIDPRSLVSQSPISTDHIPMRSTAEGDNHPDGEVLITPSQPSRTSPVVEPINTFFTSPCHHVAAHPTIGVNAELMTNIPPQQPTPMHSLKTSFHEQTATQFTTLIDNKSRDGETTSHSTNPPLPESSTPIPHGTTSTLNKSEDQEQTSLSLESISTELHAITEEASHSAGNKSGDEEPISRNLEFTSTEEPAKVSDGGGESMQAIQFVATAEPITTTADRGEHRGGEEEESRDGIPRFITPSKIMYTHDSRPQSSDSSTSRYVHELCETEEELEPSSDRQTIQQSTWRSINNETGQRTWEAISNETTSEPRVPDNPFIANNGRSANTKVIVEVPVRGRTTACQDSPTNLAGGTSTAEHHTELPKTPPSATKWKAPISSDSATHTQKSSSLTVVPKTPARNTRKRKIQASSDYDDSVETSAYSNMPKRRTQVLNNSDDSGGTGACDNENTSPIQKRWRQYVPEEDLKRDTILNLFNTLSQTNILFREKNGQVKRHMGQELADELMNIAKRVAGHTVFTELHSCLNEQLGSVPISLDIENMHSEQQTVLPPECFDAEKKLNIFGKLVVFTRQIKQGQTALTKARVWMRLNCVRVHDIYGQDKARLAKQLESSTTTDQGIGAASIAKKAIVKAAWPHLDDQTGINAFENIIKIGVRLSPLVERFGRGILCLIPEFISDNKIKKMPQSVMDYLPDALDVFHPELKEWSDLADRYILTDMLAGRHPQKIIPLLQVNSRELNEFLQQPHSNIRELLTPGPSRFEAVDTPASTPHATHATSVDTHKDSRLTVPPYPPTLASNEVQCMATEEKGEVMIAIQEKPDYDVLTSRTNNIPEFTQVLLKHTGKAFDQDLYSALVDDRPDLSLPGQSTHWLSDVMYTNWVNNHAQKRHQHKLLDRHGLTLLAQSAMLVQDGELMEMDNGKGCTGKDHSARTEIVTTS